MRFAFRVVRVVSWWCSLVEKLCRQVLSLSHFSYLSFFCLHHETMMSVSLTSLGASEQRSLDPTHRPILALSYSCESSSVALQKLSWKVTCEFGSQGRSQAEDSEKQTVRSNTHGYDLAVAVLLVMKSTTLTFSARPFIPGDENSISL